MTADPRDSEGTIFTTEHLQLTIHAGMQTPRTILSDINLEIPNGRISLLTGRNGSGKTMLLRCLSGLENRYSGICRYRGKALPGALPMVRRETGFMFQNPMHQLLERSVLDDVTLALRYQGYSHEQAAQAAAPYLESLELEDLQDRDPFSLSTGEQRRCLIAGLLAGGATTLLLDEPFTGLDYPGAQKLIEHLVRIREKGYSIVVCTHDVNKIVMHSDFCMVMARGELVFSGSAEDLRHRQQQDADGLFLEPIQPKQELDQEQKR